MKKAFQFVLFLAFPLMFGIISVSNKFVPVFYGDGYEKVVYLINVISPIILAIGLSNVVGTQYLLPTKKQKEFTISVTVGAVVNIIFNILFINLWKSFGASIATCIAEFTVTGIQFYLVRKEFNISDVFKISYKYFVSAIVMLCVSILIGCFIKDNLFSIIVQISCSGILYFIVLYLLRDELILEGKKILKLKIKR